MSNFGNNGISATDAIKDRLQIDEVISKYVKLERAGKNFKGRCPFHNEKTPSFYVTPDRGIFKCFGCGKGGDVFSFVQEIERVDFKDALHQLADQAGVTLSSYFKQNPAEKSAKADLYSIMDWAQKWYEVQLRKTPAVVEYLTGRGLTKETIADFHIGYAPNNWDSLRDYLKGKGATLEQIEMAGLLVPSDRGGYDRFRERIMFPMNDAQGRIVAFSGRIFTLPDSTTDVDKMGKYINSPEGPLYDKSKILFGYDRAKQAIMQNDRCVVVEGQMDLVAAHQAGTTEAVALSGTALTPLHVKQIVRFTDRLTLALDGDSAGLKAAGRSLREAFKVGMEVSIAELPEGQDPSDVIKENPEAWTTLLTETRDYVMILVDRARKYRNERRVLMKYLHAHVYPYIHLYTNALLRDDYIRKMSGAFGISQEALMQDLREWESKNGDEPAPRDYPEARARDVWAPDDAFVALLGWADIHDHVPVEAILKYVKKIFPDLDMEKWRQDNSEFEAELSLKLTAMAPKEGEDQNVVKLFVRGIVERWVVHQFEKKKKDLDDAIAQQPDNMDLAKERLVLMQKIDLARNKGL